MHNKCFVFIQSHTHPHNPPPPQTKNKTKQNKQTAYTYPLHDMSQKEHTSCAKAAGGMSV